MSQKLEREDANWFQRLPMARDAGMKTTFLSQGQVPTCLWIMSQITRPFSVHRQLLLKKCGGIRTVQSFWTYLVDIQDLSYSQDVGQKMDQAIFGVSLNFAMKTWNSCLHVSLDQFRIDKFGASCVVEKMPIGPSIFGHAMKYKDKNFIVAMPYKGIL